MTRRAAGFTLVEMMVGLTLMALVMGGIYTVAIGTLKAKIAIDESSAVYTAGPKILDLIEKDLRGAYVQGVKDLNAFKAQREGVGGEEVTIIDLVSTSDSKVEQDFENRTIRADITEVGYRMRVHDTYPDVLELYRREQPFFDDDLLRGGNYYLVYDRVRSMVIDFFEPPDDGTATSSFTKEEGRESWDAKDEHNLPAAARITLILAPPPEVAEELEDNEESYTFIRWVVFPNADDRAPDEEGEEGGGDGDGGSR